MRTTVRIEKLVYGGAGLARHEGQTMFVPFVLPGEQVEVDVSAGKAVSRGAPAAWVERSPGRAEPPCPVFARCGGCHYQHIPYEHQGEFKQEILRETLRRIGGLQWNDDIPVVSAEPWGYRNRSQLRFASLNGTVQTGFFAAGSHRLVAADECAVNSPALNRAHRVIAEMAADRRFPRALRQLELVTNESQLQINLPRRPGPMPGRFWRWCSERLGVDRPGAPITFESRGDRFRVSGRSFFQVNRHLVGSLAEQAIGAAKGALALDLYCGVGLLTVPLARRFSAVVGVDSGPSATRDLHANAQKAGLPVRAVQMDVLEFLRGYGETPDLIVADPPRAGLGDAVVEQLQRIGAPRLRLVSCDPATLARDLKGLLAGGYEVETLALVDLFPQTYHVETVAALRCR
ncbi:MAG: class I SAM-dependent RNA methyltransferase [Bryobacterales bacterium]|nr:class I SAM-dependent RNA methyltransferase [Bryobacterales bacterium]